MKGAVMVFFHDSSFHHDSSHMCHDFSCAFVLHMLHFNLRKVVVSLVARMN